MQVTRAYVLICINLLILKAAAFKLESIDMVCINYKDMQVLKEESMEGQSLGFTGKQAIHPSQVDRILKEFSISEDRLKHAKHLIEAYKVHLESNGSSGAFNYYGIVVDLPIIKQAQKIIDEAKDE